jgi:hypothetical protein
MREAEKTAIDLEQELKNVVNLGLLWAVEKMSSMSSIL